MPRVSPMWTGEYGQSSAINDLDEELEYERAARRRQAQRFESAQSDLKGGLDRVDSRLGGVADRVELVLAWTELRFQLLEFDEYEARKEIRKTLRALAQGLPARLPETGDVPGYWLPPAAAAALPLVLRDRTAPGVPAQRTVPFTDLKAGLESARERDEIRAELFNLAVGRCFDQPALIDLAVLRLLSAPGDLGSSTSVEPGGPGDSTSGNAAPVAAAWRSLWEHAALGEFGPSAADQLTTLLRERFDPAAIDESELEAWDQSIVTFGASESRKPSKAEAYAAFAEHLAELRETGTVEISTVENGTNEIRTVENGTNEIRTVENVALATGAVETAPYESPGSGLLGTGAAPLGEPAAAPSGTLHASAVAEPPAAVGDTPDGAAPGAAETARDDRCWRIYLQELIEEPSPAELPLVLELEALELGDGPTRTRPSWSAPAGTVATLLRRDLFKPETPLPLRRIALEHSAPLLRSLLETPEPAPAPTVVTLNRRSVKIGVTAAGADPEKAAAAESRISRGVEAAPAKTVPVAVAAALGALAVITAVAAQWFLAVVFALAVLVPLWMHRNRTADHAATLKDRDEKLADLRAAILKARDEAAARDASAAERHAEAEAARARLLTALPQGRH